MTGPLVGVVSSSRRRVAALGRLLGLALLGSVCIALGSSAVGLAQAPGRPFIRNVTMDGAGDVLTIAGAGFGTNPQVVFDGEQVPVLPGATDTQITIVMPSVLLRTMGTYRLTVIDPVSQAGEAFVVVSQAGAIAITARAAAGSAPVSTGLTPAPPSVLSTTADSRSVALPRVLSTTADNLLGNAVAPLALEQSAFPHKTALGYQTLINNITVPTADPVQGDFNTALGFQAMQYNTTGGFNTAVGTTALFKNTSGTFNTALGVATLAENTTGGDNTATGEWALYWNTTGNSNTANGLDALVFNTTGSYNTAVGRQANTSNTTGDFNTSIGTQALYSNTTGAYNTASGTAALYSNSTGVLNTADGLKALYSNVSGSYNAASGYQALYYNTFGHNNTASGYAALLSNTTGSFNTAMGKSAGLFATSGSYNIYLGADVYGAANDSNTIRIGSAYTGSTGQFQTFIAGIRGGSVSGGQPVVVDAEGRLGTAGGGSPLTVFDDTNTHSEQLRIGHLNGTADYGIGRSASDGFLTFTGTQPTYSGFRFNTANATSAMTITNGGLVGLGVSAPTRPLEAANGAFLSMGGVWTNASSRSLKDRIEPLSAAAALDAVSRLEPVTFVYKASSTDSHVGFIAEDVPALVASPDRRGLAAMDVVAVVTKAVQVQLQQLEVQEQHIHDQDATIADLRARLTRLEALLAHGPAADLETANPISRRSAGR